MLRHQSRGNCKDCGKRNDLWKDRCFFCRVPADRRQLVMAGIPWGSANGLAALVKRYRARGKNGIEIGEFLTLVHPRLMANIAVEDDGTMRPKSKKYEWVRRGEWLRKRRGR